MTLNTVGFDIFPYSFFFDPGSGRHSEIYTALDAPRFALKAGDELIEVFDFHTSSLRKGSCQAPITSEHGSGGLIAQNS
jgi:hypothetical protein